MSLRPNWIGEVPEETAEIARAAFPKGNLYLRMRDELGSIYTDKDFADLFPMVGQHAESPWRLALVTVMQFAENLTDRQAADAVRSRIDWKYALGLEMRDPGFHFSILSDFRMRLVEGEASERLLTRMLEVFKAKGLVKARGRQRTDSTHVLAKLRTLNRLEMVAETLQHALNELAVAAPDWLKAWVEPVWFERYRVRLDAYRLPTSEAERQALASQIGQDGIALLEKVFFDPTAPLGLLELPAVQAMQRIWIQQFCWVDGQVRFREKGNLPPAALMISSPHDLEARYTTKRSTTWTGYKVHLTESCDVDQPHVITHVLTTSANVQDSHATAPIHAALEQVDLLPREHLVDTSYNDSHLIVESQQHYGIELLGPVPPDTSWQAREGGFAAHQFRVDWKQLTLTCPGEHVTHSVKHNHDKHGTEVVTFLFSRKVCGRCPLKAQCTTIERRTVTLRPQLQYETLQAARLYQQTEEFKQRYAARAGVEGTISQAAHSLDLRHTRYIGLAKTHLQNVSTAVAVNLCRIVAWLNEIPHAKTRLSPFAALAA